MIHIKKFLLIFFIIISTVRCAMPRGVVVRDEELIEATNQSIDLLLAYNINANDSDKVVVRFGEPAPGASATCTYIGFVNSNNFNTEKHINVERVSWFKLSPGEKIRIITHELIHCQMNRPSHDDRVVSIKNYQVENIMSPTTSIGGKENNLTLLEMEAFARLNGFKMKLGVMIPFETDSRIEMILSNELLENNFF